MCRDDKYLAKESYYLLRMFSFHRALAIFLAAAGLCAFHVKASAQTYSEHQKDSIKAVQQHMADSINALAADPDFIKVSLLIVEPGNQVYSQYGHAALRMECPSNNMDFCFSFEMNLSFWQKIKFFFSSAKSGFTTKPTETFIEDTKDEQRGITAYYLNLTPKEEQALWMHCDKELLEGLHWDYDYLTTNCSSMCIYMVESALQGEHIEYHNLHPALTGTYTDLLNYITRKSPWAGLFWKLRMGSRGKDAGSLNDKLAPELLPGAWQNAELVDSAGNRRPMLAGSPVVILPNTGNQHEALISPTMALVLVLVVIVLIILCLIYKKKFRL